MLMFVKVFVFLISLILISYLMICHDWQLSGREFATAAPTLITTAQTLAPNHLTSARWQCLYPGYSGSIFVQWEKVETCCLSLFAVIGSHQSNELDFWVKCTEIHAPLSPCRICTIKEGRGTLSYLWTWIWSVDLNNTDWRKLVSDIVWPSDKCFLWSILRIYNLWNPTKCRHYFSLSCRCVCAFWQTRSQCQ